MGRSRPNFRGATKGVAIFHQNFFNIVGMTKKDNLPAQNAKLYSIAVFSKNAREEREGIPLYRNEHSKNRQAFDAHQIRDGRIPAGVHFKCVLAQSAIPPIPAYGRRHALG
jgi:hypothetical protein